LKRGVKPEDHCVIYTGESARFYQDEKILNESIQMIPRNPREKLDMASRLNYAKVYTVEHNVKVLLIGKISSKNVKHLVKTFNEINMVSQPSKYYDAQPVPSLSPSGSTTQPLSGPYPAASASLPRTYGPVQSAAPYMSDGSSNPRQHYPSQSEPDTESQPPQYDGSLYEE
jgi:hypothetical protein